MGATPSPSGLVHSQALAKYRVAASSPGPPYKWVRRGTSSDPRQGCCLGAWLSVQVRLVCPALSVLHLHQLHDLLLRLLPLPSPVESESWGSPTAPRRPCPPRCQWHRPGDSITTIPSSVQLLALACYLPSLQCSRALVDSSTATDHRYSTHRSRDLDTNTNTTTAHVPETSSLSRLQSEASLPACLPLVLRMESPPPRPALQ